jgi:hypothetical protein
MENIDENSLKLIILKLVRKIELTAEESNIIEGIVSEKVG